MAQKTKYKIIIKNINILFNISYDVLNNHLRKYELQIQILHIEI
jgi:hypothetical protein